MPSDDIRHYVTSDTDFYDLLGITFETSQKDIDRAWRKTALKYHPDKVGNDAVAREKFHLAQIGYDLLSDPSSKAIYDNARNARLQRKRQNELLEGQRRQMKDDLEAREKGVKRPRGDAEMEEEELQRVLRRLAEDTKRRRKEKEETLKREIERQQEAEAQEQSTPKNDQKTFPGDNQVISEIDRTVKVKWAVEGEGGNMTAERVKELFSTFGKVESADLLKTRMLRLSDSRKKQLAILCMVQFASVVGAHAAVEDFSKQQGPDWRLFDSVFWASNKEPDFIHGQQQKNDDETFFKGSSAPSTPVNPHRRGDSHPFAFLQKEKLSTPNGGDSGTPGVGDGGLRKKPSFASFSPAASTHAATPPPFGQSPGFNSPSLEEITMIRLKEAEKRRLAAEIQRQDEEADAAEAKHT